MSVDLLLKNGLVYLEGKTTTRSIAINAGMIEGIYTPDDAPQAKEIIDCEQLYIIPGAIDTHVHLRDLNQSEKEDFATGTMAAAAGGVTTVVDMPNSQPPVLKMDVLEEKITQAQEKRYVNVGFFAGIPRRFSDFSEEMVPNILGLKVYPHAPLAKGVKYTPSRIKKCLELSKKHNLPLLLHPDASNPKIKPTSIEDFFRLHSCEKEVESLKQFLVIQRAVDTKLHICHVSCASTVRMIEEYRAEELLTAEVCPHHLFLASGDYEHEDGIMKVLPPLRSPYDTQVLKDALRRCTIDIVVSDHAPHTEIEKKASFLKAASGIPGLETTVPLLLTEVFQGNLSWVEFLRICCSGPARIFGLVNKGVLTKGYDADLVVVSREEATIKGSNFYSKAKLTPFEGKRVVARPVKTIVGGRLVYDDGKFLVGRGVAGRVPVRKT